MRSNLSASVRFLAFFILTLGSAAFCSGASVELWQAKNGTTNAPTSPVDWARGNAGSANSHYVERYSIPYRLLLNGLTNGPHRLVIEWDTRWSGLHALDYVTHYQRMDPHDIFGGHLVAESVQPLDGLPGPFDPPRTFPIPAPAALEAPIPGQPALSFGALPAAERLLTIWNGEITNAAYLFEEPLSGATSSTRLAIDFVSTADTAVLAWGGHIGSQYDWGLNQAAISIRGAPYHMRVVSFDGQSGNQDRSMEASLEMVPPPCEIEGPSVFCQDTPVMFRLAYPFTAPEMEYQWSLAGAEGIVEVIGPTDQASIQLQPLALGEFQLAVAVSLGTNHSTCQLTVRHARLPTATTPLQDLLVCYGSDWTLSTEPSGIGPFSFVWSKDGDVLDGEDGPILTRSGVTELDAGEYCVVVTGQCGGATQCAQVDVTRPPVLTCPADLLVSWWDAVPDPDPTAVQVSGGYGEVTVVHAGDTTETNGCDFVIHRLFQATDDCGLIASCEQIIEIQDRVPPVVICPSDITVECDSHQGTLVEYAADAFDNSLRPVSLSFDPPSGSILPYGVHLVMCQATDACGNTSQCGFTVTVADTIPPELDPCPAGFVMAEDPPGSGGAPVTWMLPGAADQCDPSPLVYSVPESGSVLPLGLNTIECVAVDVAGNESRCSFTVQVVPQTIVADTTADSGPGSLRQALMDANAAPGTNRIVFQIPGDGPFVIELDSPLPPIQEPLTIDGTSQPGYVFKPVIGIDGGGEMVTGLRLATGRAVVRGVVLSGFDVGLQIDGPDNIIQGNFIGIDPSGSAPLGNRSHGIVVTSSGNLIGGLQPEEANVIAANGGHGLVLDGADATGNRLQGNWVGWDPDGLLPTGNTGHGIFLVNGAFNNLVGGSESGAANHIAHNDGGGIVLDASAGHGNPLLSNSIFANGGLGIDLGGDGVTPNDEGDVDNGPNESQNYPALSSVLIEAGGIHVTGSLRSRALRSYLLEFFVNDAPDASGFGEGQTLLGRAGVSTGADGMAVIDLVLPGTIPFGKAVTATATDEAGNTSEFSGTFESLQGPFIVTHPVGAELGLSSSFTHCEEASGSPTLVYQWRLNGASILGATNECLVIPSVQVSDGGDYSVVVANAIGAVVSDSASLVIILPQLQAGDDFADRTLLTGKRGSAAGNNFLATREVGEPFHFTKPGRKSVWYTWQAPATGIATFATTGSTFDTLLAIYTGEAVDALSAIAGDEDRGGFYTSGARFNAVAGTFYHIAIDGFGQASGRYLFEWDLEVTDHKLPEIFEQPVSLSVARGDNAVFMVVAEEGCLDGHHDCRHDDKDHHKQHEGEEGTFYQWLFNGEPILGAYSPILTLTNVQPDLIGTYSVLVALNEETIESFPALLQINATGSFTQPVLVMDKLLDAALEPDPLLLGIPFSPPVPAGVASAVGGAGGSIVRGYTGTHVFDNLQGRTESFEPPICGAVGGASMYLPFVVGADSEIFFSTQGSLALDGSPLNTILALVLRAPDGSLSIPFCNDNAQAGVVYSEFTVPVQAGVTNLLLIETVNGVRGVINLFYSFIVTAQLTPLGTDANGAYHFSLEGRENMNFEIQVSENLSTWSPIMQGTAPSGVFEFVDQNAPGNVTRYYRARLLP